MPVEAEPRTPANRMTRSPKGPRFRSSARSAYALLASHLANPSLGRKLVKNGVWLLALNATRQILGVVTLAVLVRLFTKDEYGQYQFIVSIVGVCGVFVLPGLQVAVVQSVARGHDTTYLAATRIAFLASTAGTLVCGAVAAYEWFAGTMPLFYAAMLAAVLFPASQGLVTWKSYQFGKERFKETALSQGAALVIAYIGTILLALALPGNIVAPLAVSYTIFAIQNLQMHWRIVSSVPRNGVSEENSIRYGVQTSLYLALNTVGNYADRLILFFFLSPESLATYAAASRIPELLKDNLQAIRSVMIPSLSRKSIYTKEVNTRLNVVASVTCVGLVLISIVIVPLILPIVTI